MLRAMASTEPDVFDRLTQGLFQRARDKSPDEIQLDTGAKAPYLFQAISEAIGMHAKELNLRPYRVHSSRKMYLRSMRDMDLTVPSFVPSLGYEISFVLCECKIQFHAEKDIIDTRMGESVIERILAERLRKQVSLCPKYEFKPTRILGMTPENPWGTGFVFQFYAVSPELRDAHTGRTVSAKTLPPEVLSTQDEELKIIFAQLE